MNVYVYIDNKDIPADSFLMLVTMRQTGTGCGPNDSILRDFHQIVNEKFAYSIAEKKNKHKRKLKFGDGYIL